MSFVCLSQESKADACKSNPSSNYDSWYDPDDVSHSPGSRVWYKDTGGNCDLTPDVYGVQIYKMGFCGDNPLEGIIYEGTEAGITPSTEESCINTFLNQAGESLSLGVNTLVPLAESNSVMPEQGTYPYVFIELSPVFEIAGSYGPINGTTMFSDSLIDEHNGAVVKGGSMKTASIKLKTFQTEMCNSAAQGDITDHGTLSAVLLDSNYQTFAQAGTGNDSTQVEDCGTGVDRLLAVMTLSSPISITSSTKGLDALFSIEDSGINLYYNGDGQFSDWGMGLGPFSVKFNVIEN